MGKRWVAIIGTGLVAAMVVAPGGVAAGKKKPRKVIRTETHEYAGAGGTRTLDASTSICIEGETCRMLSVLPKEKFVSIEINDAGGQPAPFFVTVYGETTPYCGSMERALALKGDREIQVMIRTVSVPHCSGVATTGSFTATFSNRP